MPFKSLKDMYKQSRAAFASHSGKMFSRGLGPSRRIRIMSYLATVDCVATSLQGARLSCVKEREGCLERHFGFARGQVYLFILLKYSGAL